jgi:hypothetical protein
MDDADEQFADALFLGRDLFRCRLQADLGAHSRLEQVDQELAGQDGQQAAAHIICEGLQAQPPQACGVPYAHDTRYDGGDDQRHDGHAQQPQEDLGQRVGDGQDALPEHASAQYAQEEPDEDDVGQG